MQIMHDNTCEFEFTGFKNNRLNYKCKECKKQNKKFTKPINESIKNFAIIDKFCNGDLDKFFLLLRKGVYPYESIRNLEKFDETSIPPKEAYYSELNEAGISDADYAHVQKVWKVFKTEDMVEYHDLYVQFDTLLLPDVY